MKERFSSRLLLMGLMLSLVVSMTGYDYATATKLVRENADTFIDCFTNTDRCGYNASQVGFGPNMPADAYMLGELVTLYAWVVYNNNPMQHRSVSFEVYSPVGLFLVAQNMTDDSGVAWIKFRLPTACDNYTKYVGKWHCYLKVYLADEYYEDTLDFDLIPPEWYGDGNGDGKVGLPDLMILAQSYVDNRTGTSPCPPDAPNYNPQADYSGDGPIGLPDLMVLAMNYNNGPLD